MKSVRELFGSQNKLLALSLAVLLVVLIGIVDSVTGPELSLVILYLIPISIAVSFVGPWASVCVSVGCVITYLIADKVAAISYSHAAIPYWNVAVRLGFFLTVTYVLTKRKLADKQLAESEERFRLLVEGSKDYAILMLDSHGMINSWNLGAERIFGYSYSEIVRHDFSSFYAKSEIDQYKPERLLATVLKDGSARDEGLCLRRDGTEFWADVVLTALKGSKGEIRGLALVVGDVTERKVAEESVRMYAALHQIDRCILRAPSSEMIAGEALEAIRPLIPFQTGSVFLFDFESDQASLLAYHTDGKTEFSDNCQIMVDPDDEEIGSLKAGMIYTIEDLVQKKPFHFSNTPIFAGAGSYVSVPLLSKSELIGCLTLTMAKLNGFTSQHLQIAREVSDQLAVAIHNAYLFQHVRSSHQRMQVLSHRLLEIQEAERRHLARELHDEIGQALTAVKIHLQELDVAFLESVLSTRLQESIDIVEKLVQQVRSISLDLRPLMLDDLGLVAALRWYVARQAQLAKFSAHFTSSPSEIELSPELETACFRVAQEALTNIVRHADAKHVFIEICSESDELRLLIKDDGVGFNVTDAQSRTEAGWSMGILGMRERVSLVGGKIEIESVPSCGTEIRARFPMKQFEKATV